MTHDDSASLRALAVQCRRLALGCTAADVGDSLDGMAITYDRLADEAAVREREPRAEAPPAPGPLIGRN
jgi:hypothetical protein